jgi:hypothetical protein
MLENGERQTNISKSLAENSVSVFNHACLGCCSNISRANQGKAFFEQARDGFHVGLSSGLCDWMVLYKRGKCQWRSMHQDPRRKARTVSDTCHPIHIDDVPSFCPTTAATIEATTALRDTALLRRIQQYVKPLAKFVRI